MSTLKPNDLPKKELAPQSRVSLIYLYPSCPLSFRAVGFLLYLPADAYARLRVGAYVRLRAGAYAPFQAAWMPAIRHLALARCLCWQSLHQEVPQAPRESAS